MAELDLATVTAADGRELLAAAEADWLRPIPHCPAWDAAGLVGHMGAILGWIGQIVATGQRVARRDRETPPAGYIALASWYTAHLNRTIDILTTTPDGAPAWTFSTREPGAVRDEIKDLECDSVVDWVAFTPGRVRADIHLFGGQIGQYVFISSASAYQAPPARMPRHRVHTAAQSVLAVLPRQDRLRGAARRSLTRARLPGHDRAALAHLRPDPGAVRRRLDGARADGAAPDAGLAGGDLVRAGSCEIADLYLADPARQVTDASLDAVMDKQAVAWAV